MTDPLARTCEACGKRFQVRFPGVKGQYCNTNCSRDARRARMHKYRQRNGDINLSEECEIAALHEEVPARAIALGLAIELERRGLGHLNEHEVVRIIMESLDEGGYIVVRRQPPEVPPDSRQQPLPSRGPNSIPELEKRFKQYDEVEAAVKARGDKPGWVYYLQVGDKVKIGFSENPERRLKSYPPESSLLAIHPGTRADERAVHATFKPFLTAGREWFTPSKTLDAHIKAVNAEHGPPPERWKPHYRKTGNRVNRRGRTGIKV